MVKGSLLLTAAFVALPLLLAAAFVFGIHRAALRTGAGASAARRSALLAAAGTAAWLLVTGAAAASGRLRFAGTPPTMLLVVAASLALAVWIGTSRVGERLAAGLPLAVLVGVQGFRLPLELLMHQAYAEGLMPRQMSYSGLNFDIVTGATAIVVAGLLAAGRLPRGGVLAWSVLGSLLLLNILGIAILSTPIAARLGVFAPENVWITGFPWVWLVAVMVPTALAGHIVVFRRLRRERAAAAHAPARAAGTMAVA